MLAESRKLLKGPNDQKVLAAVLQSKPSYFVTGNSDFFTRKIKSFVNVKTTREVLKELGVMHDFPKKY